MKAELIEKELEKAKYYVNHPDLLKSETEQEILDKKKDTPIHEPYPNLFAHRMTYYRGFINYPARLENYLSANSAENAIERNFFPYIMDIEPNRTCNFKCIMCLHGQEGKVVLPPNMKYSDLVSFIEVNDYITEVKLHGLGEPLLVKSYENMIQYLIEKNIWSRIVTNGSLLHVKEKYKLLFIQIVSLNIIK